jgi:hypothetical protein
MTKASSSLHAVFMFIWHTIFSKDKSAKEAAQVGGCSRQPGHRTLTCKAIKMRLIKLIQKTHLVFAITALVTLLSACGTASPQAGTASSQGWKQEFNIADRKLTHTGESKYFILLPGFQTILESQGAKLIITVLDETKEINGITTRIVEEREEKNGELYEISRNFFAIDQETSDVFYFGEEVDFYEKGKVVGHRGEWIAYENENRPGLIMPGTPEVGMKYYQEIAPGVAMDRAEVIKVSETFNTTAGEFKDCLITEESSELEPGVTEYKTYAPSIGLVQDQSMKLTSYGYVEKTSAQK